MRPSYMDISKNRSCFDMFMNKSNQQNTSKAEVVKKKSIKVTIIGVRI